MPDFFPVLELPLDSPVDVEQLGSKEKFWFRLSGDPQPWLFKFAREDTGEAWSEKFAAEIALLLGVPAARVELASIGGRCGCASRSVVRPDLGEGLVHGSEVLAGRVLGYDKTKRRRQSDHNVPNILAAVKQTLPASGLDARFEILAGFAVLDAVICNTDRHHDNWALLVSAGNAAHRVAPSFDHASSLGRELTDDRRSMLLREVRVEWYALRGRGGIYWRDSDEKGENPLALAIKAVAAHPARFDRWLDGLRELSRDAVEDVAARVPENWMSREARRFAVELVSVAAGRLKACRT